MTINYMTEKQFYAGVAALVSYGLKFVADADRLTIVLTGGY